MALPLPIEEPRRGMSWPRLVARGVVAGFLLWILVENGRSLRDEIAAMDAWIEQAGSLGPLVFVLLAGIMIPLFVPVTALKVSAGALFGPWLGALLCLTAQLSAAVVIYGLGRKFLSARLSAWASKEPRMQVVREAAEQDSAGRQFAVRMTPLSFTLICYVFAALGVRFKSYMLGCMATIPSTFVTVWFAHAARRATELSDQVEGEARNSNLLTIAAALTALLAFAWLARRARRHLFPDPTH